MRRRHVAVGLVCALIVGILGPAAPAAQAAGGGAQIQSGLLAGLRSGRLDSFVVEFAARADLDAAAATRGWTARGRAVYRTLTLTADRSQSRARALVRATPGARGLSFWLTNVLVVSDGATPALARRLAALPGVRRIRAEKSFPLVDPVERHAVVIAADEPPPWGITKIGAPDVWADGITGSGVVVANVDTGVDYLHEALVEQYRGNLGGSFDHNYSWWDPTGICGDEPCDNVFHGTHTMGTMVGGDGPGPFTPDIGVAPGATWIAAKGCEDEFCTESSLLSAGEFVVAPTDLNGDNPDPSKRPDIVNNSWGGGPGDGFYLEVVQAWRAAGIIPVFSAGNSGPECDSGGSPGDYLESFSVGATDPNDNIAEFSSRGPSSFGKVNPDVSAPGVNVVSSTPGDGYDSFSGTSMAAPHTSGTLALVLSAELALLGDVDGSTDAVRATAVDILDDTCGGDEDGDPNNVFGDGRIDAQAAVSLVATGGTLAGDVTDVVSTDPVAGAKIEASAGGRSFTTTADDAGHFELFLGAGSYTVTASAFGYQSAIEPGVEVETDLTTTQDFFLAPLPRRDVTGTVTAEEDGTPIEGAEVRAVGTPVDPVTTDADGNYTLTLPIGDYTIRVASGGCTSDDVAEVTLPLAGLIHDLSLTRKLDDFGHGCRRVAFDWVDAANETALFGDQTVGRLALPFSFPFYGESYDTVFVTDNGYLTFEVPEFPDPVPDTIPSSNEPNAAIYALWQNLIIDAESAVRYETVGVAPDRAFVVEFEQLKAGPRFGDLAAGSTATTGRVDVEVKLWEDGRIDLLYGDNAANPGDGRDASIGIENADGSDALQFSFADDLLSRNVAYRYESVPNGFVSGLVTDANDGLPVAGAAVTAKPGGRTVSTQADGTYSLRLRPGTYTLTFTAQGYVTHEVEGVVVADGDSLVVDAVLDAPVAGVAPSEIDASVDFGGTSTTAVTISNTGTSDLTWEFREREGSRTPPDLPPVPLVIRKPVWAKVHVPASVRSVRPSALPPEALVPVVDDPDDDSEGAVEVTQIRGGSDNVDMSLAIDFSAETPMDQPVGFVLFDTDQDPSTGFPPEEFFGLPGQDIGIDYFADLFGIHDSEPVVFIVNAETFELVAEVPAVIEGQSVSFSVPLEAFGNDDGTIDIDAVIGDFSAPLDWVPDEGHGTVQSFTDAPWIDAVPAEGVIPAGGETEVEVTLGAADLPPGEYVGQLFLLSDAPKQPALHVDLALTVGLPAGWGKASGAVLDAHSFESITGAEVTVHTTYQGEPLDLTDVSAGSEGTWSVIGPSGTWDADVALEGYLPESFEVTIEADHTVEGQDVFLHADQPHGTVRPRSLRFTLLRGRQDQQVLRLGNLEGHRDLTFSIGEVALPEPGDGGGGGGEEVEPLTIPVSADADATDSRSAGHGSPGHGSLTFEGDVLKSWETGMTLPWGVGYRAGPETVTLSDPLDLIDVEFTPDGERITEFDTPWVGEWAADLAWDAGRELLWHVNVGGDNGIYGIDPTDGSVVEVVTGPEWTGTSQRGLAYDQATDTFYIGGWNEGIVYHVAGPSWPTPGETLESCTPDDPNISGLAWNPAFQKLWEATNSEFDDIWLIDPETCETESWIPHPDPGFAGAGLELDAVGNLWTVSQNSQQAYLIDSGLPTFSDVPWLDVTPVDGVVEAGEKTDIVVSVDSTGLTPGAYEALVAIVTDDPEVGVATVRVRMLVTKYQRFVNVGGGPASFGDGTSFVGDRPFANGGFGWFGDSSVRTTGHTIKGTPYQRVFKDQRQGMDGYRFTVPNGRYRVRLGFAEIAGLTEFGRIMDVFGEGRLVFNNLDIAGRVGRWRALTLTFETQVRDGRLVVRFAHALGAPPVLNSIQVTWLG